MPKAGFFIRSLAFFLDLILVIILGTALGILLGNDLAEFYFRGFLEPEVGLEPFDNIGQLFGSLAGIMIISVVLMVIEGVFGRSFGKWMLKLKTVGLNDSITRLMARALLKYVIAITSLIAGLTGILEIASVGQILGIVVFIGGFLSLSGKRLNLLDIITKSSVLRKV